MQSAQVVKIQMYKKSLIMSNTVHQMFSMWEAVLPRRAPNCFRGGSVNESERILRYNLAIKRQTVDLGTFPSVRGRTGSDCFHQVLMTS